MAHYRLGLVFDASGDRPGAIAAYREAIRLKPDYAEAHYVLGLIQLQSGDFAEARDELRTSHELGSKRPDWAYPSKDLVTDAERLATLAERLAEYLSGKARPADNADRIDLARVCYATRHYAAKARFLSEAMAADPTLADDIQDRYRYNAACSAALAGSGRDRDDPPLDADDRAKLRGRALSWLRDDLAAWSRLLDADDPKDRAQAAESLRGWTHDPDLADVREPETLANLPEPERADWRAFWDEVDRFLKRSEATP